MEEDEDDIRLEYANYTKADFVRLTIKDRRLFLSEMGIKLDPKKTTRKQLEDFFDEKYDEIKEKQNEILNFHKEINEGKKVIEEVPTESSFSIISPKAAKEFIPSSSSKKAAKITPFRPTDKNIYSDENNTNEIINNNNNNKIKQENSQSDDKNNYTNIFSGNANQSPITPWPFANPPNPNSNPNNTPFSSPFTSIFSTPQSSFQENIKAEKNVNNEENNHENWNNNENSRLNSPSKLLAQFSPKRESSPSRLSFQTPSSPLNNNNVLYPSLSSTLTDDLLSPLRSNNPLDETIDDLNDDLIDDGDGDEDVDDVDFARSIPFSSPPLKKKNKLNKNDNNDNNNKNNNQKLGGKKVTKKITRKRKPSSSSFFSSPLFILLFFLFAIITAIYLMSGKNDLPIEITSEQVNQQINRFLPYFAYSLRIQYGKYQCEESLYPYLDEKQTELLIDENNYLFKTTDLYNYLRGQNTVIENTKLHVDVDDRYYSYRFYALDNPIFSYSCQFNHYFYQIIFSIIILVVVFVYTYYIRFITSKLKKVEMILNNNPDGVQETHLRDELFRSIVFNFLRDILMKLVTHRMRNDSRFAHTEQKQNNIFVPVWQFTNLND